MRGRFSVRAARDLQRAQQHADAAPCGQRVAGRLLQEQAIAQQLLGVELRRAWRWDER
ncbi:hypothetical protein [Burkholderia pseudomallei]|nr:hypothetical protein [Burkholderia pseudomallei]